MTRKTWRLTVLAAVLLGGVAFAVSLLPGPTAAQATRTVYMAAVEPKGGTSASQEAFPNPSLLPAGGGYVLKAPDNTGRWEVSTYQWQPSFIVVNQGEQVTLEIIGINGAEHVSSLPPYVDKFTVKRGQLTKVTFTASRAGIFPIVCVSHQPSMTGALVVLPK
jgi:plastocyanin